MSVIQSEKQANILIFAKSSDKIREALAEQTYTISIAAQASDAIDHYHKKLPDVFVLDALGLLQQVSGSTPILFVGTAKEIDAALEAGATDCYIGKIHPRLFAARIANLITKTAEKRKQYKLKTQKTKSSLESELHYRSLFEAANDGILLIDAGTGKIIEANPEAAQMLGYARDELQGIPIHQIEQLPESVKLHEHDADATNHLIIQAYYKRHDGSMMPIETSSRLMVFDGRPTIVSYLRDITERKRAYQAELKQRQFAEALLDSTAALNRETELEAVLDAILANVVSVMPIEHANIMLIEGKQVRVVRDYGYTSIGVDSNILENLVFDLELAPNLLEALEHKKPIIVHDTDVEGFKWASSVTSSIVRSILTAPIMLGQNVIGFINLDSIYTYHFQAEHVHQLQAFANHAAVAILNARLFSQIQTQMENLEARVVERTNELSKANMALKEQILQRQEIEDKLNEERTLLRVLIDNIPDPIYFKDTNGKILLTNHSTAPIPKGLHDIFAEHEKWVLEEGKSILTFEASYEEKGEKRWLSATIVPLQDAHNETFGLVGINRDITDLQKIQIQLAEERTLLRTIIDTIPDAIYVKDLESRFRLVNTAVLKNMGLTKFNEIIGKTDAAFYSEEKSLHLKQEEEQIIKTAVPQINQHEPFINHDGNWHHLLVTKLPWRDVDGNITGIIGINHDITSLKRTEEQLEQVLRSAQCLLWSASVEQTEDKSFVWDMRVANEKAAQSFLPLDTSHCTYSEAWLEAILPEDKRQRQTVLEQCLSSEKINCGQEFRMLLQDGSEHWLAEESTIQPANENRWYLVGVCTDISERKEAEQRLQELNQDLEQRVLQRTQELTTINAELRQEVLERKRAEEAERRQRILADTLRENVAKISSTLDRDEVFKHLLGAIKTVVPYDGANIMLIEGQQVRIVYTFGYAIDVLNNNAFPMQEYPELPIILETGEPYYISDTSKYAGWVGIETLEWIMSNLSVPINIEGHTIGFLNLDSKEVDGFTPEHTQWLITFANQAGIAIRNARYTAELEKRVQERTQELESETAQLQAILNAMRDGVIYANTQDEIQYINDSLQQITGFLEAEWMANIVDEKIRLHTAEEVAHVQTDIAENLDLHGYWRGEIPLQRKDGNRFEGELTRTIVKNRLGEAIGMLTVLRDVSDEKLLEEQKRRFISTAVHELRTPIANLKTRLYLLRHAPEKFEEHIAVSESVVNLMQNLVEDMFDLGRFERGMIKLEREKLIFQDLLKEVLQYQKPEADRQQISLVSIVPEEPMSVFVDPYRLTQVFMNLVANALRHTPVGGRIMVSLEHDGTMILLKVIDNGEGIGKEHIGHLFEPFYRGTDDKKGAGLGLAIVQEIVNLHHGTITVESEKGKGSSFIVQLPFDELTVNPDAE